MKHLRKEKKDRSVAYAAKADTILKGKKEDD